MNAGPDALWDVFGDVLGRWEWGGRMVEGVLCCPALIGGGHCIFGDPIPFHQIIRELCFG